MATTALEIADTAIKVGLGVLLSSITTYLSTKSAQTHELQKTMRAEKAGFLKDALAKLDECSSLLNETRQSIYHVGISADPAKDAKFSELMAGLTKAYNLAKAARSLSYLAGLMQLADLVRLYCDAINELRGHYNVNRFQADVAFIDKNTDMLSTYKDQILAHLSEAFESIYA